MGKLLDLQGSSTCHANLYFWTRVLVMFSRVMSHASRLKGVQEAGYKRQEAGVVPSEPRKIV